VRRTCGRAGEVGEHVEHGPAGAVGRGLPLLGGEAVDGGDQGGILGGEPGAAADVAIQRGGAHPDAAGDLAKG